MRKIGIFFGLCLLAVAACKEGNGGNADAGAHHQQPDAGGLPDASGAPDAADAATGRDATAASDAPEQADPGAPHDAGPACEDVCVSGLTQCTPDGLSTCGDIDGDSCAEWGPAVPCGDSGNACWTGKCDDDVQSILSMLSDFHAEIEAEDLAGVLGFFDPAFYDPSRGELSGLNAGAMTMQEIETYFASMFASLANIRFDALATGDGMGNPYRFLDQGSLLIADFTPLQAIVENPGGGYSYVSDYEAGALWYEERSEGWFSFFFVKQGWVWKINAFGLGFQ